MSANIEYNWEWPADRVNEKRILVQIKEVKKEGTGLFGINKSPSLVSSLPDPYIISGVVVNGDGEMTGNKVRVVAPLLKIENIKSGSLGMFGIVENNVCICIVPIEDKYSDLNAINCP